MNELFFQEACNIWPSKSKNIPYLLNVCIENIILKINIRIILVTLRILKHKRDGYILLLLLIYCHRSLVNDALLMSIWKRKSENDQRVMKSYPDNKNHENLTDNLINNLSLNSEDILIHLID